MKQDVVLPKHLKELEPLAADLPTWRHEWMTNDEIARILISFTKHADWMTQTRMIRPETGRVLMFNRKKVKYRQDLYIWKRKRKSKWPREDHVKLKVNSIPCITAIYVHSDVLPTFHRRCYWFIQNPDVVLVHYLNYPYLDDGAHLTKSLSLNSQSHQWRDLTKVEVLQQIRPMLSNLPWPRPGDAPMPTDLAEEMANRMANKHFVSKVLGDRCNNDEPRVIRPKISTPRDVRLVSPDPSYATPSGEGYMTTTTEKHPASFVLSPLGNTNAIIIFNQPALPKCLEGQPDGPVHDGGERPSKPPEIGSNPSVLVTTQHGRCITHLTPRPSTDPPRDGAVVLNGPTQPISPLETSKSQNLPVHVHENHPRLSVPPPTDHLVCPLSQPPLSHSSTVTSTAYPHTAPDNAMSSEGDSLGTASAKDYGVKDVMVPNCNDALEHPRASPFADSSTVASDLSGFDVFDIECLFNTPKSMKPNSVESISDQANSSTESAVGDLFPQHFWNADAKDVNPSLMAAGAPNLFVTPPTEEVLGVPTEFTIIEYSPDWSYTEGGIKVLLTGTWEEAGNYMCCFNGVQVPATVVQNGVLKCYCPAHGAGHVDLCVARNGTVVTHPVKFEYKPLPNVYREMSSHWLQLNEDAFKTSILDRLEKMEQRLDSMGGCTRGDHQSFGGNVPANQHHRFAVVRDPGDPLVEGEDFEQRVIKLCQRISRWCDGTALPSEAMTYKAHGGMTVLHFAAALGYSMLITSLRSLWLESENEFLSLECEPSSVDKFHCSPLMWAAALGRVSCVNALCDWRPSCLHLCDVLGRSPVAAAIGRGHILIATRLEGLANNDSQPMEGEQEEEDDADVSSISESVVSSRTDTVDSGEDSMETDVSSADASLRFSAQPRLVGFDEEQAQNHFPEAAWSSEDVQDGFASNLKPADPLLEGQGVCDKDPVTSLAEQVVEAIHDHYKQGPDDHDHPGLTLRSLPHYVNSRCGPSSFREFPSNQALYRRGIPVVCHMNWSEFLQLPPRESPPSPRYLPSDRDFDSLRLTEHEQRQLYIAARTVLNAYRHEGIPLRSEVGRASLLIQCCYRKYKKFAMSKKMNEAAVLIQSKFRSYQEQKRFQRSRHAAILIQSFYRSYKGSRPGRQQHAVRLIEDALRNHMTRRHHQAARKIQRFLRLRSDACSRRHSFNQL